MRTFAEFVELQETSLNRIRSKSEKGGMAILSGQRGDKSSKENKERSKRTEKRIRGAGLPGPTKVSEGTQRILELIRRRKWERSLM